MQGRLGKILIFIGAIALLAYVILLIIARTSGIEEGSLLDRSNLFPNTTVRAPATDSSFDLPGDPTDQADNETPDRDPVGPSGGTLKRLLQISQVPVSAFGAYVKESPVTPETSSETAVIRYVDQDTGYIFDTDLEAGLPTKQITNTAIFNSHEGWFNNNLSQVILRFFSESTQSIQTFTGTIFDPTSGVVCTYPIETTLRPGDTGREVENLQQILLGTAIPYDNDFIPGEFDTTTAQMVATFQRSVGLSDDNIVGAKTRSALTSECINQAIRNYLATRPEQEGVLGLDGTFLPENLLAFDTAPNSDTYAYITHRDGVTVVTTSSFSKPETGKNIWVNNGFSEWNLSWVTNDYLLLGTKPSGTTDGFYYLVNTNSGSYEKIAGNRLGLTGVMSPDRNHFLMSYISENTLQTSVLNLQTGNETRLPFNTLTDKCLWGQNSTRIYCGVPIVLPSGTYPDDWYLGEIVLTDTIQIYDITEGRVIETITPETPIDIDRPQIITGNLLGFLNKGAGELWILQI